MRWRVCGTLHQSFLQPVDPSLAVEGMVLAIHVLDFKLQGRFPLLIRKQLDCLVDNATAVFCHPLR